MQRDLQIGLDNMGGFVVDGGKRKTLYTNVAPIAINVLLLGLNCCVNYC